MTLTKAVKKQTAEKFGKNAQDTGSTQVQVAMLTERIREITAHLKKFQHDFSAKHGLLKMVAQRRKYLKYLNSTNAAEYASIIAKLELKK